jgi:hypothetical protein
VTVNGLDDDDDVVILSFYNEKITNTEKIYIKTFLERSGRFIYHGMKGYKKQDIVKQSNRTGKINQTVDILPLKKFQMSQS